MPMLFWNPPSSNTQISCLLRKLRKFPVAKGGITDFIKLCVCNTYKLPEMVTAVCATIHSSQRISEILQSFYWWQLCSQTCHKIVGHWSAPCVRNCQWLHQAIWTFLWIIWCVLFDTGVSPGDGEKLKLDRIWFIFTCPTTSVQWAFMQCTTHLGLINVLVAHILVQELALSSWS
jgi:hypothetical protein